MNIRPIKSKNDYEKALARLEVIFDARPGTRMGDELELLGLLIDQYEREHFSLEFPDPVEAIRFRMEQLGLTQSDLAKALGLRSRASEILNKRRKLSLEMIRVLHSEFNIPTEVLVRAY